MNHTQKSLLLQLVAERRRELDDARRAARAALSAAHPRLGEIAAAIDELDELRAALVRDAAA